MLAMEKRFVKKLPVKAVAAKKDSQFLSGGTKKVVQKRKKVDTEGAVAPLVLKADAPLSDYDILNMDRGSTSAPLKRIVGFRFTFLTAKEISNMATVKVTSSKMNGENSVHDPRMGTIENYAKCVICGCEWKECPGHPGELKLPIKLPHPMCLKRIAEFLSCICGSCHRLVLTTEQLRVMGVLKYKGEHRFKAFLDIAKKTVQCGHSECKKPHGKCTVVDDKFSKVYKKKSEIKKIPVSYEEVSDIILNFRESDFRLLMGMKSTVDRFDMMSHPQHMLLQNLCVLPPSGRPYVESNGNCCNDDLTHKLVDIVKVVTKLNETGLNPKYRIDLEDSLMFHVKTFMDNGKSKARDPAGRRPLKAIRQRMTGKGGQIRGNIQGKRTGVSSRTVISPNANLHVNELGVPRKIADTITFPVRVTDFNYAECQKWLENDKILHITRGSSKIDVKFAMYTRGFKLAFEDRVIRNGKELSLGTRDEYKTFKLQSGDIVKRREYVTEGDVVKIKLRTIKNVEPPKRKPFQLKIGDEVERKMQDGDWTIFNRQPTLHEASMRAKRVRIHDDDTFQFDLSSTEGYNAD